MNKISFKAILAVMLPITVAGCGTTHKMKFADYTEAYKLADYCKAADRALDKSDVCQMSAEDIKPDKFNIDEKLNGGTALFLAQKTDLSNKIFEETAKEIQEDLESMGLARGAVEVVANASIVDYNPMIMDGIYLHSYTLLNALAQNNKDEAKIQVNRAYNVQQKAVETFSKEIQKQNEENAKDVAQMQKEAQEANQKNISDIMANYKEFERFNGYANFVNPYVTYMSGLYLMTNGHSNSDYETASNYLKRVSGMVRHNKFVKQDLSLANKLASGTQKNLAPTAWVVFENGLVANFEEFRLDLPIFIATNNVKTASLALPYPKEREIAYKNISVSNGNKKVTTELLADVDNIFMAEFKKKLPIIVTKAVTKLTLQTVAQAVAQNVYPNWNNQYAHSYGNAIIPETYTIDLTGFRMPTPSTKITSPFGPRWRRMHNGLDLKVNIGDTIVSAFDGKVRIVKYERRGYGKYVVIRHDNGLETIYGHLSKQLVEENQLVKAGEPIGLGGNTGRSTGSHLHFETRFLGIAINPIYMFDFPKQDIVADTYTFRKTKGVKRAGSHDTQVADGTIRYHKVKSGDTLSRIAKLRGVSVSTLCKLNRIKPTTTLRIGQVLRCS